MPSSGAHPQDVGVSPEPPSGHLSPSPALESPDPALSGPSGRPGERDRKEGTGTGRRWSRPASRGSPSRLAHAGRYRSVRSSRRGLGSPKIQDTPSSSGRSPPPDRSTDRQGNTPRAGGRGGGNESVGNEVLSNDRDPTWARLRPRCTLPGHTREQGAGGVPSTISGSIRTWKKNVSTEAPPTNGPREGRRRGPSHPFRSTPHGLCRSRPRQYDSARAGGSHQSGGRGGGTHAGMTTGKQACRPPSLSRPPTPSQRTARAAPHFGDERLEGRRAGVIHAPKGDPGQGQATRAQAVPGAAHPLPSLGRRPGPGLVGPRGRSGKSGCWSTRPGGPRTCLGSAVTVTPSQACTPNLR